MDQVRRDGILEGVEVRLRRADGTEFWAALSSRLIAFEGQDTIVTAVVDLTERKRVEAELARQRQILNQNEKMSALGSLLAGVAHELNNPLSVVVGHASLLEDLATDAATRDRALKIRTAADRCARIVRTFLAMARSKPRQRTAVHLNAVIDEALEIVAYGLRTADVEVVRALAPDLPPVGADPDQLHQVFANLFVNAQQALQGVPPPRRLTITSDFDAQAVWVEVADNGPGVPADIGHRVFEPFFTTKPQGVGTGVGLSVCHGIVAAHGGEIRLEPPAGQGATFVVRLPRAAVEVAEPPAAAPASQHDPAHILVVDDEPEVGQLLIDILERDGHRVDRVSSGREALTRLADGDVDLILSDLRMPDLDGPALYRALAAQRPDLLPRLVFMTGDTLGGDMTGFLSETGVRVLEKPLDPAGLSARVRTFLASRATGPTLTSG
jgi:signal transduction histidine kinase